MSTSSSLRLGFPAALGAYVIWGSLPLYIRANWRDIRTAFRWHNLKWLALSGLLIGVNWLIYIWAVNQGRTMEASLGYYINPLVNVLFGMLIFSERLRPAQWVAVAVAAIGVGVMTLAFGHVPWVALGLCFTFAFYSVIRKKVAIDSRAGFLVEVVVLTPLALAWFSWFLQQPDGRLMGTGGWDIPMLILAGPITATPLILFGLAAKRLKLSTVGMMQYIGPTLQFLIATLVFHEAFGWTHAIAFGCIWAALAIYTTDSVIGEAKARRLARTARPA